jgi:hypothetical protein
MPFHSCVTLKEAEELVLTKTQMKSFRLADQVLRPEFAIPRTWPDGDILAAMEAARKAFGLED